MYRLREIEEKDIKSINSWRNDPELIANLGAPFRFINPSIDIKWFSEYMEHRSTQVRCSIVNKQDEILGLISLVSIDHLNGCAELHIMIGNRENQGKGIGTFAVKEMLRHAFFNLNLHRVELAVVKSNVRAHRLYEKCGFVKEGTKRKSKYKNGRYISMDVYAILKEEYLAKYSPNISGGGVWNNCHIFNSPTFKYSGCRLNVA